ncbi:MAG: bifunctional hydroxymethylpyrimidine kinase/phosphomethylpyrimidine kinase [Bacteroidales bacterium]|nr:bifunctional hydroxymethylpyrimidine kinase/phosphomethylpyrimidine kinase [Candidatus Physcousia equi]
MKEYKRVLSIAGSDSGGGAGIQADIKTISALGCYAATAVTAVTVQNTQGVAAVHAVPAEVVAGQIEAVLSDIGADAIKMGMLQSVEIVRAVASALSKYPGIPIVLDPVMVSTSGHRLIEESAVRAMTELLFPLATVITPNIPEAELLLDGATGNESLLDGGAWKAVDLPVAARTLGGHYGVSVLLKAGHLVADELVDYFYNAETKEMVSMASKRVETNNTHGTGCTLSSAVAALLARGHQLTEAVQLAKGYIHDAIVSGADYRIGKGHGPVDHFCRVKNHK